MEKILYIITFTIKKLYSPLMSMRMSRRGRFRVDDETMDSVVGSCINRISRFACLRSRRWMGIRRLPLPQKASKIEAGAIAAREVEESSKQL